jgi:hypothetical protein
MKIDLLGPDLLEFNEHGVPDGNVLEEVFELVGEILIELNSHNEFLESHQEILDPIQRRQLSCRQIFLSYLTRFRVCREGIV